MPAINMTGKTIGRLLVLGRAPIKGRNARWLCKCDCGNECTVTGNYLRSGHTSSCGCVRVERSTAHGMYGSPEYNSWAGIIQRCKNPENPAYERYGGRGISVCDRWQDFTNFFSDMGPRPSAQHSIDRVENDRGYEPGNCRWATAKEQSNNRRSNRLLTYLGRTMTVQQWSVERGISYRMLQRRVLAGWSVEKALAQQPNIMPMRG